MHYGTHTPCAIDRGYYRGITQVQVGLAPAGFNTIQNTTGWSTGTIIYGYHYYPYSIMQYITLRDTRYPISTATGARWPVAIILYGIILYRAGNYSIDQGKVYGTGVGFYNTLIATAVLYYARAAHKILL
jgi:hypothetical protein